MRFNAAKKGAYFGCAFKYTYASLILAHIINAIPMSASHATNPFVFGDTLIPQTQN
jgi:hypothetical protein